MRTLGDPIQSRNEGKPEPTPFDLEQPRARECGLDDEGLEDGLALGEALGAEGMDVDGPGSPGRGDLSEEPAGDRGVLEAVAAEARGDEQPIEAADRSDDRMVI